MVTTDAAGASSASAPRLEALTGLRWFAALGVFAFHVREFYPLPGMPDLAVFGNSGVTFFFVLSGFVLGWSFSTSDPVRRFYWRRFARIWPALAVSTLVAVPVFYAGRNVPFDGTEQLGVLASLALVQAWIPDLLFAGNPAAWSLSDEAFFYALFPFLVRPILRAPGWLLAVLASAAIAGNLAVRWWAWGQELSVAQERMIFVSPPGRLAEFVLGVVGAVAIRRGWVRSVPVPVAVALTAAGVWALWYCRTQPPPYLPGIRAEQAMNQVMAPLYALLIAAVAGRDLRGGRMLLRGRPLVALGRWSYSFYLVHATVLHWLVQHWTPRQAPGWANWFPALVALAAALAAAVVLYALVEQPAERWLRALPDRRRSGGLHDHPRLHDHPQVHDHRGAGSIAGRSDARMGT